MKPTRIRAAVAVLAVSVTCGGALVGCSVSRDQEAEPQAGESSSATASASPEGSPTTSASSSANPSVPPSATPVVPSATPTPPASPSAPAAAATIEGALLSGAELPRLNPTSAWAQRRTGPIGARAFGLCQKFDLLTIGALRGVERTFVTRGGSAGQQVAEFPDAENTVRAGKVIEAWQRDCAGRVRGADVRVRPIVDVPVSRGKGWTYLVSQERNGEGRFDSLGVVVSDARMTMIRMEHAGQDHNYPAGKDPMTLAVRAAAVKLG